MTEDRHRPPRLARVDDDREAWLIVEQHQRSARRREIYGRTVPHAEFCAFDAYGIDLIEGRI